MVPPCIHLLRTAALELSSPLFFLHQKILLAYFKVYLESDHLSFRSVCIIYLLDCCQNLLIVPFLSHAAAKMIIEKCIQSTSLPFSKPCIPFTSCLEHAFHVQMYSSDIIVYPPSSWSFCSSCAGFLAFSQVCQTCFCCRVLF